MTEDREALQRRELRRYRGVAVSMLLAMVAVFAATHAVENPSVWLLLARAAAEAGVVGGLADWFAVTALFRRPLGLPIPHTAIIPRNKERIGEGLGRFVERNFLAPDLIAGKLQELDLARALGEWLCAPGNSDLVSGRLLAVLPGMFRGLNASRLRRLFRRCLRQRLRRFDPQRPAAQGLRMLVGTEQYRELVGRVLISARGVLLRNEDRIYAAVSAHSRWWVPSRADRRMAEAVVEGLEEILDGLAHPDHPMRVEFDRSVLETIDRLETSPAFAAEVEAVRDRLLHSPEFTAQLDRIWDELYAALDRGLAEERGALSRALSRGLQAFGRSVQDDPELRGRVNGQIEELAVEFITPYRREIGTFIAEVVGRWDAGTVSDRLELAVGRDLQYIRMNGTLVGALVGAVLFGITRLF
ncbi:MAG: DUF445 domain-containing protein [Ectothiorhodospiraceae bacterium]|jgi:uncharacterized membrane-anchored protein YjiN (DUF445 family)